MKEWFKKLGKVSPMDVKPVEEDEKAGEPVAEVDIPVLGKAKAKREQILDIFGEKSTVPVWSFEKFEKGDK